MYKAHWKNKDTNYKVANVIPKMRLIIIGLGVSYPSKVEIIDQKSGRFWRVVRYRKQQVKESIKMVMGPPLTCHNSHMCS